MIIGMKVAKQKIVEMWAMSFLSRIICGIMSSKYLCGHSVCSAVIGLLIGMVMGVMVQNSIFAFLS